MTTPIDMESSGNSLDVAVSGTDEAPQSVGEVTPKSGPSLQASNNATPMRVDVPATEVTDTAAIRSVSKDGSEVALMEDVEDDDVMEQLGNDSDGFPMDDADVCRDSTGHSPISKELERHIQHQQHLDRTQRQHQRNPSSRPLRATAALRRTIRSCSSSTSRRSSRHSSISSGHGEEEQDIVVESWCEEILPETVEAAAVEANLTTSGISNTTTATSAAATPAPITTAAAASAAAPSQTPPASPAVRYRESKKPPLPWRQSASTATAAEKSRRGPLSPYAQPRKGPAAASTGRRATTTTAPTRGGATTAGRGGLHKTSSSSLLQTAPAALSGDGADASTASSMGAELATPAAATTGRRGRLNATAPPTTNTAAVPRSTCNPNFASILTNKGRLYTVSQKDIVVDPDQATKTPNELLYMTKRCLLPPLVSKAEQERTVTVVFDLDETLCNNRRVGPALLRPGVIPMFRELRSLCASPKYQVTASDRSASTRLYNQAAAVRQLGIASHGPRMVSRRPPTFSVLRLEIVLWTASMEQVARPVMLRLDPENSIFDQRIYRDVRWYRESNCVKDLRRLGRPLDQIVIVENSTVSVQMNRSNAILMTDFINSKHDRQIYVVRAILTDWIRRCNRSLRLRATELLAEQRLLQQQQQDGLMAGPSPLGSEARVEPSANRPDDFCEELDKTVAASTDRQYDVSDTATMDPDSPLIPASLAAKTANTTALDKMLATPGFITFLEVKKTPDEAPAYGEVSLPAYLAAHPFMSPGTNYIRLSASKEVIRSRRSSSR